MLLHQGDVIFQEFPHLDKVARFYFVDELVREWFCEYETECAAHMGEVHM